MAAPGGTPSAPLWTITDTLETAGTDNRGQPARGVLVSFLTVSGKHGSVFVADSQLSEHTVRQLVTARAQLLESITQLSG